MGEHETVLVADGSPEAAARHARALTAAGYRVLEAGNGLDALTAVVLQGPDIVVIDLDMPGWTGIEVLRWIESRIPDAPPAVVVLLSGDEPRPAALLDAGAADVLRTPPDADELVARVRRSAAHRRLLVDLRRRSTTDSLTDLPNRRGAEVALARLVAGAEVDSIGVALVDVDRFKGINDHFGHEAGDAVLREVAGRLRSAAPMHTVARWGGEEFLVAGRCRSEDDLRRLGERLRRAVASGPCLLPVPDDLRLPIDARPGPTVPARPVSVTVSVGMARIADAGGLTAAIARADASLYRAKAGGRNRVEVDGDATEARARAALGGRAVGE